MGIGALLAAILVRWRVPWFHRLAHSSLSLLNTYLAPGSEDDKLPAIEQGTQRLLLHLLRVSGWLLLALALGTLPVLLWRYSTFFRPPFAPAEGWSLLAISLGATLPFLLPSRHQPASGYSALAQLLHRLALDHPFLGLRLLRGEIKAMEQQEVLRQEEFLIITGLARAGTTSFLNAVLPLAPLASLNYANMPFLLSPRRWSRIYRPKEQSTRERSHQDGVQIGLHSSEALEEYFFKAQAQDRYIEPRGICEYKLSSEEYQQYLDYQRVVRGSKELRYAAKNNNFLVRYRSLRNHNPHFRVVILFRQPLYQAASLMEKHQHYRDLQEQDSFILEYMDWLGHHEFGQHHKPFRFPTTPEWVEQYLDEGRLDTLDYWLALWVAVYQFALSLQHEHSYFVAYEDFCAQPDVVLGEVLKGWRQTEESSYPHPHSNERKVELQVDSQLKQAAKDIYQQLEAKIRYPRT